MLGKIVMRSIGPFGPYAMHNTYACHSVKLKRRLSVDG